MIYYEGADGGKVRGAEIAFLVRRRDCHLALFGFARPTARAGRLQHSGSGYGFDGFRFEQSRESGVAHLCSVARGIDGRTVLARSAIAHSGAFRGDGGDDTPVREAIMQLVREGGLEMRSGQSITVTRLSLTRYRELREIRLFLEGWRPKKRCRC